MKFKLDKWKKYAFVGLGVLLFGALIYRVMPMFGGLVPSEESIEIKEKQLTKYHQMMENGKGLDKRLRSIKRSLDQAETGLLSGKTPSLAAVDLQNTLQGIADQSGVEIRRFQVLKPKPLERKPYLSIEVEFYIFVTVRQLRDILYRVETSPKYLTVENVKTMHNRRNPAEIRCQITVAGFVKAAGGKTS